MPPAEPRRDQGADRTGARLTPDERRRQLVGIGLSLLAVKPIQQLTVEEVARAAGISRNLLFHYFASKREFYAAVVGAACRRLVRACHTATTEGQDLPTVRRLEAFVDAYVGFVARHPESYASVIRASGGDEWVHDVWDDTRTRLAGTVLEILDRPDAPPSHPLLPQAVRGWLSMVEEMALSWSTHPAVPREGLVALLAAACQSVVDLAATTAHSCSHDHGHGVAAPNPVAGPR